MKIFSIAVLILGLLSCSLHEQENTLVKDNENDRYFLDFSIAGISYSTPDFLEEQFVSCSQKRDQDLVFQIAKDEYPYYNFQEEAQGDSIKIYISIPFISKEYQENVKNKWNIEFLLFEDINNLVQLSDSTYRYNSNKIFYERLQKADWNPDHFFSKSKDVSMILTMPEGTQDIEGWHQDVLSSFMFYFDHEKMFIDKLKYMESTDQIFIDGRFDVEMKILSCGFYSFYQIKRANFHAVIE